MSYYKIGFFFNFPPQTLPSESESRRVTYRHFSEEGISSVVLIFILGLIKMTIFNHKF